MTIFTKLAAAIFAAFDSAGGLRRVDNAEAALWGTEVERLLSTGGFKIIDAQGPFSGRAAYNAQPKGFTYLSIDGDGATTSLTVGFIKKSNTSGDWSVPVPWQGPAGPDGEQGSAGEGFTPAGAWVVGATYAKNDMVSFGGRSFVSFAAGNIGHQPPSANTDDAYWQFVPAAVGPEGPQGPVGNTGATGSTGATGATGPANSLAIGTVTQGTAGAIITGAAPSQTLNLVLPKGDMGATGADGDDGWTPVLAVVADSARRVQRVVDWTGGTGTKPATGKYVGATGLVDAIADGVDIRGASGAGTGDMAKATYDPTSKNADAFAMDSMAEGTTTKIMTATERTKLAGIATGAQVNDVTSVAGKSGAVTLAKGDVGLGNADNTSDANKPISTATQTALNGKYATADKASAANIRAGTADKVVTPDGVLAAMDWVAITAGATPALDHAASCNRTITHTVNATMGCPVKHQAGLATQHRYHAQHVHHVMERGLQVRHCWCTVDNRPTHRAFHLPRCLDIRLSRHVGASLMTLYLEHEPGEFRAWQGEAIGDVTHPHNIEQKWSAADLAAIALFAPAPAEDPPIGKRVASTPVQRVAGVVRYVHVLEDVPSPPVPQSISPLQARKALRIKGFRAAVDAYVAMLSDDEQEEWEYATEIRRDNSIIGAGVAAGIMTEAQVDEVFILGDTL